MAIRYYHPSLLFEVTARTVDGAFFFDPLKHRGFGPAFNAIVAIAQARHKVRVYAYFFMSNHYHAIYGADDPDAFANFLCEVHGNIARYANRLLRRSGPVFNGRCDVMPIVPGDLCLPKRLCYIMGQAIKVQGGWDVGNWPGANTNRALMYGEALVGRRFDQHQKTLDKRLVGGPKPDESYVTEHRVMLSPLPCWAHLSESELRARYQAVALEAQLLHANKVNTDDRTVQINEITQETSMPTQPPMAVACAPRRDQPKAASQPLSDQQRAAMSAQKPNPQARDCKKRRPAAYADSDEQADRYREAYERICERHAKAREELAEQAALALRGQAAKAVKFPLYTFAAVARTGSLALELGLSADLGTAD